MLIEGPVILAGVCLKSKSETETKGQETHTDKRKMAWESVMCMFE